MRPFFFPAIVLALLLGCQRNPPVQPVVLSDTQVDLSHQHPHRHSDAIKHGHVHADSINGTHSHDHAHGHRHAAAPNGGTVLSLKLVGSGDFESDSSESGRPSASSTAHLEIVLEGPNNWSVFLLSERPDGTLQSWSPEALESTNELPGAVLTMRIRNSECSIPLIQGDTGQPLRGKIASEVAEKLASDPAGVDISSIRLRIGTLQFQSVENLHFQDGHLDAFIR